jgi:hypothetical protein
MFKMIAPDALPGHVTWKGIWKEKEEVVETLRS